MAPGRAEREVRHWRGSAGQSANQIPRPIFLPKLQVTPASTCRDAGYLSIEMLLKGGPPGHELESKPVVNHGKPA